MRDLLKKGTCRSLEGREQISILNGKHRVEANIYIKFTSNFPFEMNTFGVITKINKW